ncbi:putative lipoprotein [Fulvimarina pelagi HTCC2506]|uniref:Putative lipoprotein n=2 Tax=Fulvimarina pelagi TaxID=217511 RepID=Q0G0C2_9HYPH|nr:hypothetical protein [Fulvimarina pelagi]EAU40671.1 putative lipoprotein [Fulvimarina pelagi HTCC2506]BAT31215.1 putative lipoprotein [Fulvimarina pelagi]
MAKSFVKIGAIALVVAALAGCSSTSTSSNVTLGAPSTNFTSASDQVSFTPWSGRSAVGILDKPYFMSFRARNAESYGHSFIAFGQLDSTGRVPYDRSGVLVPSMVDIAGFWPEGGPGMYSMGHFVPVPSGTGPTDGDTEIAYLQNEMTIPLTAAEYQRLSAYVRDKQAGLKVWSAVAYNCSSFNNDVAEFMGMRGVNHLYLPRNWVAAFKKANPGYDTIPGVDITS